MKRLLPAALLLAACAPSVEPSAGQTGTPAGGDWTLATLDGTPLGAPATLRFTPEGIAGEAPCNSYAAVVAQGPGGAFSLGSLDTTERGCDALDEERRFYAALGQVMQRREEPDRLILSGPGGTLVFTR